MLKLGLIDKEFSHISSPTCYCGYDAPTKIEWDRKTPEKRKIVFFTERCYDQATESRFSNCIRVAWPLEPKSIHAYAYNNLMGAISNFQYVLTFDEDFKSWVEKNSKAKVIWWTPGGSWIWNKDWKIYPKTRKVQIIASKKDWTHGHRLRHKVINQLRNKIDGIYGRAYQQFNYTHDVFKDYMYAIVIENIDLKYYWTDKLISAFATGTVPIMWNTGWIGKYFNVDGMILWENINDLKNIIDSISVEDYNSRMPAIKENFQIAKKYSIVEDVIYDNLPEGLK
jgi:hypothetical protein